MKARTDSGSERPLLPSCVLVIIGVDTGAKDWLMMKNTPQACSFGSTDSNRSG